MLVLLMRLSVSHKCLLGSLAVEFTKPILVMEEGVKNLNAKRLTLTMNVNEATSTV